MTDLAQVAFLCSSLVCRLASAPVLRQYKNFSPHFMSVVNIVVVNRCKPTVTKPCSPMQWSAKLCRGIVVCTAGEPVQMESFECHWPALIVWHKATRTEIHQSAHFYSNWRSQQRAWAIIHQCTQHGTNHWPGGWIVCDRHLQMKCHMAVVVFH